MVLLVAASVAGYVFLRLTVTSSLVQGILLTSIVSALNYFYTKVTVYLMQYEDHKYRKDYYDNLMIKLAFFKFVNIHLPIIYALVSTVKNPLELIGSEKT